MNPSSPTTFQLDELATVIRHTTRLQRISAADAEDFAQTVHLRFLERNYDIFTKFDGRSSLRTYLMVVVRRMLLDWRNAAYGKWRPSAAARRLGPDAIRLDRLMNRDGLTRDEATQVASASTRSAVALWRDLAERIPIRPRPQFVDAAILEHAEGEPFMDLVQNRQDRLARRRTRRALTDACRQLDPLERRLLTLRFQRDLSVRQIGSIVCVEPKQLYRQYERTVRRLRVAMAHAGTPELRA